jgi:CheY-like chemotaxis protein
MCGRGVAAIVSSRRPGYLVESTNDQPPRATILVVEDQAPVLKVVERSLERSGFTVITAATPEDGLAALKAHGKKVDLLLTDVVMPQMSGPELAVRAREFAPDLKLLFMSGYSGETVSEESRGLGKVSVVEKPFRPAELVQKVLEAIGRE